MTMMNTNRAGKMFEFIEFTPLGKNLARALGFQIIMAHTICSRVQDFLSARVFVVPFHTLLFVIFLIYLFWLNLSLSLPFTENFS